MLSFQKLCFLAVCAAVVLGGPDISVQATDSPSFRLIGRRLRADGLSHVGVLDRRLHGDDDHTEGGGPSIHRDGGSPGGDDLHHEGRSNPGGFHPDGDGGDWTPPLNDTPDEGGFPGGDHGDGDSFGGGWPSGGVDNVPPAGNPPPPQPIGDDD